MKPNLRPRYQWCSWYEFENNYTQQHLDDFIAGLKSIQPPVPVEMIQIDDGYSERGDWLIENSKFPKGIRYMIDTIRKAGYKAGIWVAPFMVSSKSKVYQEHPEWLLRDVYGQPIREFNSAEGDMYVLDTSHPEAFEHIQKVFRTFREWGVTYYKTDFMDWGLRDRTKVKRFRNDETSVQHFVRVLRMIRQEIGPESFWLACISPYSPFIGLADAVRFSNDVGPGWNDGSQGNLIQEGMACHYFQHVFWQNDPDTIFLRDVNSGLNSRLTPDEVYTIAFFDAMIGGFITTSDRFHKIPSGYLALWRFVQPGNTQLSCRFPFWAENRALKVAVRDYPGNGTWAVLVVNPSSRAFHETFRVKDLLGIEKAWFFDWKPGENTPLGCLQELSLTLTPHQSKLFYVGKNNTPPPADMGLFGIKIKGLKKTENTKTGT